MTDSTAKIAFELNDNSGQPEHNHRGNTKSLPVLSTESIMHKMTVKQDGF